MTTASEAWIIDGVRPPRGKGKPTGALHGPTRRSCWRSA